MSDPMMDLTNNLPNLTPRQIVEELDRYIIGQKEAKRATAVALRNRRRRQMVPESFRDEILPKNILMKGPTGVGKTEISRRLAKLAHAPFIKVEATKFTEVGYVGRDVESMIRDLTAIAVDMVKEEQAAMVRTKAEQIAIDRVLDLYHPPKRGFESLDPEERERVENRHQNNREKLKQDFLDGKLDEATVELEVSDSQNPTISVLNGNSMEEIGFQMKDMLSFMGGGKKKRKDFQIKEAVERLREEEEQKLIDMDEVGKIALARVENSGIVFLDEIDKIAGGSRQSGGPDVSRGGVQRDLLPIIEGTTVNTKFGMVRTDHILFIAAGAFHNTKPSDLLPELQGRLPVSVELESLTEEDFRRILTEPRNSLIKQNQALMATEDVALTFDEEAIAALAKIAFEINENQDNIGARRLHQVMEKLLEELFFDADERAGGTVAIDVDYVTERLESLLKQDDLRHYIL